MKLVFEAHEHTEQGPRSEQNDRMLTAPFSGGLLVAVMDGVGKGSGEAAEEVREVLEAQPMGAEPLLSGWGPDTEQPMALDMAMVLARDSLATVDGATTCTALVLREDGLAVAAHCGDTALFRWRKGALSLLTVPHRVGRHMLTQALHGYGPAPHRAAAEYDVLTLDRAEPGDVYLVASDGCYEAVPEAMLRSALSAAAMIRGLNVAKGLGHASLAGGSTDNSTAVVVRVRAA